jgi:transcription elongation factor GreB
VSNTSRARLHSAMSKAFTREEDDAGFELASRPPVVAGPITAVGARLAADKVREIALRLESEVEPKARAVLEMDHARAVALAAAPVAVRPARRDTVSFGAEVRFRDGRGRERVVLVASPGEIGLVPRAASATSRVARALIGARVGDMVELEGLRASENLLILDVRFPE